MTLADRIKAALARQDYAAHQIWTGDSMTIGEARPDPTRAAVLIGLIERPKPTILLTQRTGHLSHHAGQVAFPGGRIDSADADAIAAALREAEEEVGLSREHVTVIDVMAPYRTATNFSITPVIAAISPALTVAAHPGEVADIFEVPADIVLNPASYTMQTLNWHGQDRRFYEMYWQDKRIWGATAAMLVNLGHRVAGRL